MPFKGEKENGDKTNMSSGKPDGAHATLLKNCSEPKEKNLKAV